MTFDPITATPAEFAEYLAKRREALFSCKPFAVTRQTRSTVSFSHFAHTVNPRKQRRRAK